MKKFKYSDLLKYKVKVEDLYAKYGLKLDSSNRISKYFDYLSEIERNRNSDKDKFSQIIQKDKAKYYLSQFYVIEICHIIDAIQNSKHDKKIVKEKLERLINGSYLLSEEEKNNTVARNTTFELSLFSFFNTKGLQATLESPNPDLRLFTDNFTYNIECKRPFSYKKLEKNIKKAFKQLRKSNDGKSIPTIALSLDQVLLKEFLAQGDPILDSYSSTTALNFLSITMSNFLHNNVPMIQKICRDESCLILYYLSCLVGLKTDGLMAHTTYIVGNVYNFDVELSNKILNDLQVLEPDKNENN